jgi:hypothetical protein
MRRGLLLIFALLISLTAGSPASAQPAAKLQLGEASASVGTDTSPIPHLARQDGFPYLPPLEFNDLYGEFIDGVFVLPTVAHAEVYAIDPVRGRTLIFIYSNGSCAGARAASGPLYFHEFNMTKGYTLSVKAMYFFTLDDGTYINGVSGPCVQIVWDSERLAGLGNPATPIADNDGSAPAPDNGVVALPNTGAGQNGGTPFLWLGIGAAVLISGFALRWRASR